MWGLQQKPRVGGTGLPLHGASEVGGREVCWAECLVGGGKGTALSVLVFQQLPPLSGQGWKQVFVPRYQPHTLRKQVRVGKNLGVSSRPCHGTAQEQGSREHCSWVESLGGCLIPKSARRQNRWGPGLDIFPVCILSCPGHTVTGIQAPRVKG